MNTDVSITSYNLHGLNQGTPFLRAMCDGTQSPDIVFVQEHWLTPARLSNIMCFSKKYTGYGISAMEEVVKAGLVRGRPWGGAAILLSNFLCGNVRFSFCAERFVCVVICDTCFVNVYLPASSNVCSMSLIDVISQLDILFNDVTLRLGVKHFVCGGDFNVDVNKISDAASIINSFFCAKWRLRVSNSLIKPNLDYTYFHDTIGSRSFIDFFFISDSLWLRSFVIKESHVNLSDHLPISITVRGCYNNNCVANPSNLINPKDNFVKLKWCSAAQADYRRVTAASGAPMLAEIVNVLKNASLINNLLNGKHADVSDSDLMNDKLLFKNIHSVYIDSFYARLVDTLINDASVTVRTAKKDGGVGGHTKAWWDVNLNLLKDNCLISHRAWSAADRPRTGPLFDNMSCDKKAYKKQITLNKEKGRGVMSSSLQDLLLSQNQQRFWKVWNGHFADKNKRSPNINGKVDNFEIAEAFASSFASPAPGNLDRPQAVIDFHARLDGYIGPSFNYDSLISAVDISQFIVNLSCNKAPGADLLTAEHLKYCDGVYIKVIHNLFSLIIMHGYVPKLFGCGVTVPLPKSNSRGAQLTVGDFRGITILPVISKLFELALQKCIAPLLKTCDSQFGFKKGHSCAQAVFAARKITDFFVEQGSTVTLCSLDISKAFDSVSHIILFNKLLDRNLPKSIILCLLSWYSNMEIVVRWNNIFSRPIRLTKGVRQGSVLAPALFSIFVNDILIKLSRSSLGCHINGLVFNAIMYADDLLLLSLSLSDMRKMIILCQKMFADCGLLLNGEKSVCLRIGSRHSHTAPLLCGTDKIEFRSSLKYLGCTIEAGPSFKCSLQSSKQKFFVASNSVFAKIGVDYNVAGLTLALIDSCAVPCLLYGVEAVCIKKALLDLIDYTYNSVFVKLFNTKDIDNIRACQYYSGVLPISIRLELRLIRFYETLKFGRSGSMAANLLCMVGDQSYKNTLLKYNLSDQVQYSYKHKQAKAWEFFRTLL